MGPIRHAKAHGVEWNGMERRKARNEKKTDFPPLFRLELDLGVQGENKSVKVRKKAGKKVIEPEEQNFALNILRTKAQKLLPFSFSSKSFWAFSSI